MDHLSCGCSIAIVWYETNNLLVTLHGALWSHHDFVEKNQYKTWHMVKRGPNHWKSGKTKCRQMLEHGNLFQDLEQNSQDLRSGMVWGQIGAVQIFGYLDI